MAVGGGDTVAAGHRRLKAVPAGGSADGHRSGSHGGLAPDASLDEVMARVSRGDEHAFERLYDTVSAQVHGLIRRVLRDPAQAEEVTQEVFLEIWRNATRFDAARGKAMTWVMTMAHARAVDRVRSAQASTDRDIKVGQRDYPAAYDEVSEAVESRLEQVQVRRCLGGLTELQRESVTLAYYGGYTYSEVADLLSVPLGTVKTRLRDGLIRMRDCMGVEA
jgi:RNA polymerase sigma-70 factor (ECF subfamily)